MEYNNRQEKTYAGELMEKGRVGETVVLEWLKANKYLKDIIDMREFRISQRLDVDCGIETTDGSLVLAEIKTDYNLGKTENFIFEIFRINHFVEADKIFYLGWTFRSPAKYLLYYSPNENIIYRFTFENIRKTIGLYVKENKPKIVVVPTDGQKTTFNMLVPKTMFEGKIQKIVL